MNEMEVGFGAAVDTAKLNVICVESLYQNVLIARRIRKIHRKELANKAIVDQNKAEIEKLAQMSIKKDKQVTFKVEN